MFVRYSLTRIHAIKTVHFTQYQSSAIYTCRSKPASLAPCVGSPCVEDVLSTNVNWCSLHLLRMCRLAMCWHQRFKGNVITFSLLMCCATTWVVAAAEASESGALRKCLPDASCSILLGLTPVGNQPTLMAVREDHACGAPPDSMLQAVNPVSGTVGASNHTLFELGLMGPSPGLYRLCLCSDNCLVHQAIPNPLAFDTDVGDLLVRGPLSFIQSPPECIAGGPPCLVNITALGISEGHRLAQKASPQPAESCL